MIRFRPSWAATCRAERVLGGLIANGLVEPDVERPKPSIFTTSELGRSLCAASATKRLPRARAEKALERLLEVVAEINSDPIFLHDVAWVAVFGSYLDRTPDLGDIDLSVKLKARWKPGRGDDTDRTRRAAKFEAKYPPPASYEKRLWGFWAEEYTTRLIRKADPANQAG